MLVSPLKADEQVLRELEARVALMNRLSLHTKGVSACLTLRVTTPAKADRPYGGYSIHLERRHRDVTMLMSDHRGRTTLIMADGKALGVSSSRPGDLEYVDGLRFVFKVNGETPLLSWFTMGGAKTDLDVDLKDLILSAARSATNISFDPTNRCYIIDSSDGARTTVAFGKSTVDGWGGIAQVERQYPDGVKAVFGHLRQTRTYLDGCSPVNLFDIDWGAVAAKYRKSDDRAQWGKVMLSGDYRRKLQRESEMQTASEQLHQLLPKRTEERSRRLLGERLDALHRLRGEGNSTDSIASAIEGVRQDIYPAVVAPAAAVRYLPPSADLVCFSRFDSADAFRLVMGHTRAERFYRDLFAIVGGRNDADAARAIVALSDVGFFDDTDERGVWEEMLAKASVAKRYAWSLSRLTVRRASKQNVADLHVVTGLIDEHPELFSSLYLCSLASAELPADLTTFQKCVEYSIGNKNNSEVVALRAACQVTDGQDLMINLLGKRETSELLLSVGTSTITNIAVAAPRLEARLLKEFRTVLADPDRSPELRLRIALASAGEMKVEQAKVILHEMMEGSDPRWSSAFVTLSPEVRRQASETYGGIPDFLKKCPHAARVAVARSLFICVMQNQPVLEPSPLAEVTHTIASIDNAEVDEWLIDAISVECHSRNSVPRSIVDVLIAKFETTEGLSNCGQVIYLLNQASNGEVFRELEKVEVDPFAVFGAEDGPFDKAVRVKCSLAIKSWRSNLR